MRALKNISIRMGNQNEKHENSENLKKVAAIGTSCPDHFLRTKRLPMVLPSLSNLIKNETKKILV